MPEIVVLGFSDVSQADQVIPELQKLHTEALIDLADWARVIRNADGKVDVRQATNTTGTGAAGGALFGMLIGLLFLMPLAGLAVGAITGAIVGKFSDYGIDDKFINEVGGQLAPGTSALFLYVVRMTEDKVTDRLRSYQPTLVRTSLSSEAEAKLKAELETQTPPVTP
jgi:uncharacterized membrane protein